MDENTNTDESGEYDTPPGAVEIYSEMDARDGIHHELQGAEIHITRHARQRFLERVSGTEPYPRSRIEREFHEARAIELDDPTITDRTRIHPDSGVVYVYDGGESYTVITCFIPTPEQLGNRINPAQEVAV